MKFLNTNRQTNQHMLFMLVQDRSDIFFFLFENIFVLDHVTSPPLNTFFDRIEWVFVCSKTSILLIFVHMFLLSNIITSFLRRFHYALNILLFCLNHWSCNGIVLVDSPCLNIRFILQIWRTHEKSFMLHKHCNRCNRSIS